MNVEIISYTQNPLETVAKAASVCYRSEPSLAIVKQCINSSHLSVLEHASFTFMISGVDRNLTLQLVRHRIASYSQESQRYVDMSNNEFVYPQAYGREATLYEKSFYHSMKCYEDLIELGAAKEDARSVLPGACETRIVVTMNLRALAHFMNERLCMRAQEPIRKLANAMKQAVLNLFEKTEEKEIIRKLLVPKCEVGVLHFCPEAKTCNRHKTAKEINSILNSIEKENE